MDCHISFNLFKMDSSSYFERGIEAISSINSLLRIDWLLRSFRKFLGPKIAVDVTVFQIFKLIISNKQMAEFTAPIQEKKQVHQPYWVYFNYRRLIYL